MDLAQRTAALLDLIERYREERCAALLTPAAEESRAIIRNALADARRRVLTALKEERARAAAQIGAAEAAFATERRLASQRHATEVLARAWGTLRAQLIARWQDETARARWVTHHALRALDAVPATDGWRIDHAADWPAAEREALRALLAARGIDRLEFVADPAIVAGLRVSGGHNVLDATLDDGLLADRAALEGRLLHALEEIP
jgi:hypothetical protein